MRTLTKSIPRAHAGKAKRVPVSPRLSKRIKEFRILAEKSEQGLNKDLHSTFLRVVDAHDKISKAYPVPDEAKDRGLSPMEHLSRNVFDRGEMHDNLEILGGRDEHLYELKAKVGDESTRLIQSIPSEPTRPKSWLKWTFNSIGKFSAKFIVAAGAVWGGLKTMELVLKGVKLDAAALSTIGESAAKAAALVTMSIVIATVTGLVTISLTNRSQVKHTNKRLGVLESWLSELQQKGADAVTTCGEGIDEVLSGLKS